MIVTHGEEPVKAIPYTEPPKISDGGIMLCNDWQSYLNKSAWGDPETLYRKTCRTNFVYSTDINVDLIRPLCNLDGCMNEHRFTAEELFGKRIQRIFFYYDDPIYCERHKYYKNVKTGGAK